MKIQVLEGFASGENVLEYSEGRLPFEVSLQIDSHDFPFVVD